MRIVKVLYYKLCPIVQYSMDFVYTRLNVEVRIFGYLYIDMDFMCMCVENTIEIRVLHINRREGWDVDLE